MICKDVKFKQLEESHIHDPDTDTTILFTKLHSLLRTPEE